MRNPGCNSQRRLPVSRHLVPFEIEIPLGHAVHFAHDPLLMELPGNAGCLLRGREIAVVTEIVNARQLKLPITAHRVSHNGGLPPHTVLSQQMAGGEEAVRCAPCPDLPAVILCKHFGQRMIVMIALRRSRFARTAPDQPGNASKEILSIHLSERCRQRLGIREADIFK